MRKVSYLFLFSAFILLFNACHKNSTVTEIPEEGKWWISKEEAKLLSLNTNEKDAEKYTEQGDSRFKSGDYKGAIDAYSLALEYIHFYENHKRSYIYKERGYARYKLGDYWGSIRDWEKAIELNLLLVDELRPDIEKAYSMLEDM